MAVKRPLAGTLAASIPSGRARIVNLCLELCDLVGSGSTSETTSATLASSVSSVESLERPWPLDAIYVGHGPLGSGPNPSPWDLRMHRQRALLSAAAARGFCHMLGDVQIYVCGLLR